MSSKRIKTLSFSSSQSSNSLIDEDLLISKPNYKQIQEKNMKTGWYSVNDVLPKEKRRLLGLCVVEHEETLWEGIIEVYFDSSIGWRRCEKNNTNPIRVLYWREMIDLFNNQNN